MDEYTPCKKPDPTANVAIKNVMQETKDPKLASKKKGAGLKQHR